MPYLKGKVKCFGGAKPDLGFFSLYARGNRTASFWSALAVDENRFLAYHSCLLSISMNAFDGNNGPEGERPLIVPASSGIEVVDRLGDPVGDTIGDSRLQIEKIILMIAGMWGTGKFWDNYRQFFEKKGYTCVTPTLPGHGDDTADPEGFDLGSTGILDYLKFLEDLMGKLKGEEGGPEREIHLMGHSMGGLLAQMLATRHEVESLILLAPGAPRGFNTLRPTIVKSFIGVLWKWGFWKKPNRLSFKKAVYALLNKMPVEQQREIYESLVDESGKVVWEAGLWFLHPWDKTTAVDESKINCPVLVVEGAEDPITPPKLARKVARKYGAVEKGAPAGGSPDFRNEYWELADHAHWLVAEPGWEKIADSIYDWMQGLEKD